MLEDMQLRSMSPRTQETYISQVKKFACYFKKSPEHLGPKEIRQYQLYLVKRGVSWSVFNQTVCALRFLYGRTLKADWSMEEIVFPRQPKKLPELLSPTEVAELLDNVKDYTSRVALTTIYAGGLRLQECLHLKSKDIDSSRMTIRIEQGKGMKDRYVMLSENCWAYCESTTKSPALKESICSHPSGIQTRRPTRISSSVRLHKR
jgi:site-specific recombinase XerD